MECVKCVCDWLGRRRRRGGEWLRGLGLCFTNRGRVGRMFVFGCGGVSGVWGSG